MLENKRSRLRALERRRTTDPSSRGVFEIVIGTLRGTGDSKEMSTLALEIKGLESMHISIQDTLYLLRSRKEEQDRRHTVSGNQLLVFSSLCELDLRAVRGVLTLPAIGIAAACLAPLSLALTPDATRLSRDASTRHLQLPHDRPIHDASTLIMLRARHIRVSYAEPLPSAFLLMCMPMQT